MDLATLGIKVQTEGVAEAATSLDKLDKSGQSAAKTAEKLAPALDKTGTAAGKSSKGTGDAATSMAKLDKASDGAAKAAAKLTPAMQQTAMSAGALANATRQLPMQFTDIFTGLLTGQPIMQVALQQGGQLKDTWGGIGPALKASASYVWGLVNPFTAAAAAIGLTAYPSAAIVFLTPLPRATMNTDNGRGLKLSAYVAAMKEVCAYYAIPVVDLYRLTHFRPWNTDNAAALMPDGLHPNSAGYAMLSGIISQQLRGL